MKQRISTSTKKKHTPVTKGTTLPITETAYLALLSLTTEGPLDRITTALGEIDGEISQGLDVNGDEHSRLLLLEIYKDIGHVGRVIRRVARTLGDAP
jgi:hypothetical protein